MFYIKVDLRHLILILWPHTAGVNWYLSKVRCPPGKVRCENELISYYEDITCQILCITTYCAEGHIY